MLFMTTHPNRMSGREPATKRALEAFRSHGGILRFAEARAAGIQPTSFYRMRDSGVIRVLARGLYGLADMPSQTQPDLVTVSRAAPRGIICLVSALAWHDLTAEVPHVVDCALPRGVRPPRLNHPPLRVFWFGPAAYTEGIETHVVDRTQLRIYSPEKTLADCFKFRNTIGLDTVLDALRRYRAKYGLRSDELMRYARLCRVHKVMQPYLEASL